MTKPQIDIDDLAVQEAASVILVTIQRGDPQEVDEMLKRLKVAAARWWAREDGP
jgi:Arc/MetJ family transcription regulator